MMWSADTAHTVLFPRRTSSPLSTTWSSYSGLLSLIHRSRFRHSRLWRPDMDRTSIPSTVTTCVGGGEEGTDAGPVGGGVRQRSGILLGAVAASPLNGIAGIFGCVQGSPITRID